MLEFELADWTYLPNQTFLVKASRLQARIGSKDIKSKWSTKRQQVQQDLLKSSLPLLRLLSWSWSLVRSLILWSSSVFLPLAFCCSPLVLVPSGLRGCVASSDRSGKYLAPFCIHNWLVFLLWEGTAPSPQLPSSTRKSALFLSNLTNLIWSHLLWLYHVVPYSSIFTNYDSTWFLFINSPA